MTEEWKSHECHCGKAYRDCGHSRCLLCLFPLKPDLPHRNGDTLAIHGPKGERACVKRVEPGSFTLSIQGNHERKRWGNAEEIRKDIRFFQRYGCFPPVESLPW